MKLLTLIMHTYNEPFWIGLIETTNGRSCGALEERTPALGFADHNDPEDIRKGWGVALEEMREQKCNV